MMLVRILYCLFLFFFFACGPSHQYKGHSASKAEIKHVNNKKKDFNSTQAKEIIAKNESKKTKRENKRQKRAAAHQKHLDNLNNTQTNSGTKPIPYDIY